LCVLRIDPRGSREGIDGIAVVSELNAQETQPELRLEAVRIERGRGRERELGGRRVTDRSARSPEPQLSIRARRDAYAALVGLRRLRPAPGGGVGRAEPLLELRVPGTEARRRGQALDRLFGATEPLE